MDKSYSALSVAKRNAAANDVYERVFFAAMDLFEALAARSIFDIIVSNPPYISDAEFLDLAPEIANYEPQSALRGGGESGLGLIRKILERFHAYLKPNGSLLMEIGQGQAQILEGNFPAPGVAKFDFIEDYSGIKRVLHVLKAEG